MKFDTTVLRGAVVCGAIVAWMTLGAPAKADTQNQVFSGSVTLDGDISDFFQADGLTPKAGVCVANDPDGLNEPPLSAGASQDKQLHPSGFNQRRIMSAFNPAVNNGTIFIGIDLPGGIGADSASKTVHASAGNPNPNYNDGVVGALRGKILPFDSDGNGEADTIGRKQNGSNLFRCPPAAGDIVDVFDCASADATGATDNPRTVSGETIGARESYVATIQFLNGAEIAVEVFQAGTTPAGVAQVAITASGTDAAPGAVVSTAGGAQGAVLGWDVEIAVTNINAAIANPCNRLNQTIIIDSGSNRDGAGQGEDNNSLVCNYSLPATISCRVLFFTNNVEVVANQCDSIEADAGVLVGTTTQLRVEVCAGVGNAQNIANYTINIPGVGNVVVNTPLTPGQCATTPIGSFTCNAPGLNTFMASVTANGSISSNCVPIQTSCDASLECCGEPNIMVIKKIACLPANGNCSTIPAGSYAKSATGVKGDTQIPAFCYSITVTNTGNVTLENVTVIDDVLGNLSASFADTLPVGGTETKYFSFSHSQDRMNTVIAEADGVFESGHVMSSDNANAFVKTAAISCVKKITSPDDRDGNPNDNHVSLFADGQPHSITWSVTVTAGPGANLSNVQVIDPAVEGLCDVTLTPFNLAAGASTNITLCTVQETCPNGNFFFTNQVFVAATVGTSNGECGRDIELQPITVDSSCSARLDCLPCPIATVNNASVCAGQSAELCATVSGGSGNFTYTWTGPNGFTANTVCINVSTGGVYCVVVTDVNSGCKSEQACGTLTVRPVPQCTISGPDPICNGTTNTYTVTSTVAASSFSWAISGNGAIVGANTGSSVSIAATGAGSYTLTVTVSKDDCSSTCTKTVVVNPIPTCNITGPDPVCNGTTNSYTATSSEVGSSFSWAISGNGAIVGSNTGSSVSIATTGAGSYTLTVTVSKAGCSSTCTKTVVVNPIPTCNITGPDPICNGTTNQYSVTSSQVDSTFSWAISGNGAIVGANTGSSVSVAATGAGSYTLTVTVSKAGCSSTCTKTVVVNPIPTCNITGPDPICNGTTNQYNVTSSQVDSTFSWAISGNGAIVGSNTGSSVSVAATGAGSYTLTVTVSKAGCSSTCTKTVVVNPIPTCNITGPSPVCSLTTNTYNVTSSVAGSSFSWSVTGNGQIVGGSNGSSVNVVATAPGSYLLKVTVSKDGCSSTCEKEILVNPLPICEIEGDCNICLGDTAHLCAPEGLVSYSWTGPNGFKSSERCIDVSAAGRYEVTVTDQNGCKNDCYRIIVVNPPPSCLIVGNCEICEGATTEFCAPPGMASYEWSGPGEFQSNQQCVTIGLAGVYTVRVTDENGCVNSCTRTLITQPPLNCRILGTCELCEGAPTTACASPPGMQSYRWSGPQGFTSSEQCVEISLPGFYTLEIVDDLGCTNSCSREVVVNQNPGVVVTLEGPSEICGGTTNTYTAISDFTGLTYQWTVSGNATVLGSTAGSSVTVVGTGNYQVLAEVSNFGCGSTAFMNVTVKNAPCGFEGAAVVCPGTTNVYTAVSATGVTRSWKVLGNAVIVGSNNGQSVTVASTVAGSYEVSLEVNNGECTSTCKQMVVVQTCTQPVVATCITRQYKWWGQRVKNDNGNCATIKAAIEAGGGTIDLGFISLPTGVDRDGVPGIDAEDTLREVLGVLNGKLGSSALCKARQKLAKELIAALLNSDMFAAAPGECVLKKGPLPVNLISQAQAAAACNNLTAIKAVTKQLKTFNKGGKKLSVPQGMQECVADKKLGKAIMADLSAQINCDNLTNCD